MKLPVNRLNLDKVQFDFPFDQGKYSQIWLATNLFSSEKLAAKVFQKIDIKKKLSKKRLNWELKILSNLKSNFFPQFKGFSQNDYECIIYMEYISGPNFFQFLKQVNNFSIEHSTFYAGQLVLILEYLHSNLIVYRDLKPENVLIDKDGYLKLVDFGSSIILENATSKTFTICGTPEFLAPEILLGKGHNFTVDFWALGIFLFELFYIEGPFFDQNPMKHYTKIIKGVFKFPSKFPDEPKTLIRGLLNISPEKRLGTTSYDQIKTNKFFKNLNWNSLKNKTIEAPYIIDNWCIKKLEPCKQISLGESCSNNNLFLDW
jgi:serine/threonine protein kinase